LPFPPDYPPLLFNILLFIAGLAAFIVTYYLTPRVIERLKIRKIVGVDENKLGKPEIPSMGGPPIVAGYLAGTLILLATYQDLLPLISAALSSILMMGFMGTIDDSLRLSQRTKIFLPLLASLPLAVALGRDRTMLIPFIGSVHFGILYPVLLVPLGVVAASNLTNMLAGLNGLEAGMGLIAVTSLLVASLLTGNELCALILAPMIGALLAFLKYNKYPAKIFPGNSTTYLVGTIIAAAVILGNLEIIGVLCLTPYVLEFFIKAKGGFKAQSFGVPNPDGTLSPPNKNPQSLTHVFMRRGKLTEKQIVTRMWMMEMVAGIMAILVAYSSLYYLLLKS